MVVMALSLAMGMVGETCARAADLSPNNQGFAMADRPETT